MLHTFDTHTEKCGCVSNVVEVIPVMTGQLEHWQ